MKESGVFKNIVNFSQRCVLHGVRDLTDTKVFRPQVFEGEKRRLERFFVFR